MYGRKKIRGGKKIKKEGRKGRGGEKYGRKKK